MGNLATFLTSIFMTFAGRIVAAFGFTVVSYAGLAALQQKFISMLRDNINGVPADALALFYMAGGGVALNWFLGCTTFVIGLTAISKIGSVFGRSR